MAIARDKTINIRLSEDQRETIDHAAEALGKSRSEFVIDASLREAHSVLLDRVYFRVDDEAFEKLEAILDDPAPPSAALRELFASKMPWE